MTARSTGVYRTASVAYHDIVAGVHRVSGELACLGQFYVRESLPRPKTAHINPNKQSRPTILNIPTDRVTLLVVRKQTMGNKKQFTCTVPFFYRVLLISHIRQTFICTYTSQIYPIWYSLVASASYSVSEESLLGSVSGIRKMCRRTV